MSKKILIKPPNTLKTADSWVNNRELRKKIGLYIPLSMHTQLKILSAQQNEPINEIIFKLIEEKLKNE
jgi:hypothetical protein